MDAFNTDVLLDLPYLERAEEMSLIMQQHNWDQRKLATYLGISIDKVSRFLMPLKLCQKARDLVRAEPAAERVPLGSIELICRLTPKDQTVFLKALPLGMPERGQIEWLRREFAVHKVDLSRKKNRRKYTLHDAEKYILRTRALSQKTRWFLSQFRSMTPEGLGLALSVATVPERSTALKREAATLITELHELCALVDSARVAIALLPETAIIKQDAVKKVRVRNRTKPVMAVSPRPVVVTPPQAPQAPAIDMLMMLEGTTSDFNELTVDVVSLAKPVALEVVTDARPEELVADVEPPEEIPPPKVTLIESIPTPAVQIAHAQAIAVEEVPESDRPIEPYTEPLWFDITTTYYDLRTRRMVLDKVTPRQYVALADQQLLKYQRENTRRPPSAPDPRAVAQRLAGVKV